MYDHMTLLECIRNASPGSYVIHNEIILHPISTEKGFIAVYNSVWTKHSVPSAWRGGSTAFCRVPFHSNSYELIITRHLPLRLHRPLRNLKIILLHILPKVPLLFHLSTWWVELGLSTPSAHEKHNFSSRLSPIFGGTLHICPDYTTLCFCMKIGVPSIVLTAFTRFTHGPSVYLA